ncbi:MAG: CBS domain-containing protein [archaeon]
MIFPEIDTIKIRRQKLGINQKELSKLSNTSQSLIAKLEAGKLNPSYELVKRIFIVLDSLEHKNEKKCGDIMVHVITTEKTDLISKAIDLMKKHSISQLPVIDKKEIVGSISESNVYNKILEGTQKNILLKMQVGEIMGEPFPVINADYPISVAIPLLKSSEAILIKEKNILKGIITKSNLF